MSPRLLLAACLVAFAALAGGAATAQAPAPVPETVEDLPPGPGREETFALCAACHAYRLVSNQGMTREGWDETLTWMTQRHNMPPLEGPDRALILDYLARVHPPRANNRPGGFRQPF